MEPLDSTHDWLERAKARVAAAKLGPIAEEVGRVESVTDGVAVLSGLATARLDELLRFERGHFGFVQLLDRETVSCVLLDGQEDIEAGDRARGTGEVVRVPVGSGLLGRVVDPLGRPIDGKGPVSFDRYLPIERPAPAIIERDLITEPVQTGLLVVDSLFALGRGQRELIIGDRATGKTAVAVDTIINQKSSDIICVYVAVGQKSAAARRAIDAVNTYGAPERCIFVIAAPSATAGLQWIAPFAGFSMAEYFRDRGQHALIVIDDLSKHAATHRELALLSRQPPGREAYPGDVFHVHARLLERAAKLAPEKGGGSLTALPIAETDAGNLSAYIPTNLISITDGQIVLDAKLFQENRKPAVDVGRSVSRVGGKTQAKALRAAAESLRLDYAQFLEMEIFTRFGGVLEPRVKQQILRGRRIRAILDQPQYTPLGLASEIGLVLALQEGVLDPMELEMVRRFRQGLSAWISEHAKMASQQIAASGTLDEVGRAELVSATKSLAPSMAPLPLKASG